MDSGSCLQTYALHSEAVRAARWSPCGQRILSGGFDCALHLTDLETGVFLCVVTPGAPSAEPGPGPLSRREAALGALHLLPGQRAASGRLWNPASASPQRAGVACASTPRGRSPEVVSAPGVGLDGEVTWSLY